MFHIILNKNFIAKTIKTPGTPSNPTIADVSQVIGTPSPNKLSAQIITAPIKELTKKPITFIETLNTTFNKKTTNITAKTYATTDSIPIINSSFYATNYTILYSI